MNTAAAQEYWEGQIVDGKFPLYEWLGESGSSAVFLTQTPGPTPQKAAIKLIPADTQSAELQISRWRQASTLSHPNLLRIFDMGQCQLGGRRQYYVVMEYADENLAQVLPQRALSAAEVRELVGPVTEALSYLHAQGLAHGRLKPSNIVAVANQLKLSSESVYLPFSSGGKFRPTAYDAPEVEAQGFSKAGDVWSLGMTLVAAFTQYPTEGNRSTGSEPVVPSSVPEPYRQIARACLRVNPTERCTLSEIRARLNTGTASVSKELRSAASVPAVSTPRERKALAPLLAIAVLVFAFFVAILLRHRAASPAPQQTATTEAQPSPHISATPSANNSSVPSAASGETVPGAVAERVLPEVAVGARRTITGKIRVKVHVSVDADGQVSSASLSSPGPSRYFARLALDASRKWRFKPAEADGRPIASEWQLEYKFGRTSTEVVPREQR